MRLTLLTVGTVLLTACAQTVQRAADTVPTTPDALRAYAAGLVHAEETAEPARPRLDYRSTGQGLRDRAVRLDTMAVPENLARLHARLLYAARQTAVTGPRAAPTPATGVTPCLRASPVASAGCSGRNLLPAADATRRYYSAANQYFLARREVVARLRAAGVELPSPTAVSVR